MLNAAWLALGAMLCTLQLSTGSFPKPLSHQSQVSLDEDIPGFQVALLGEGQVVGFLLGAQGFGE